LFIDRLHFDLIVSKIFPSQWLFDNAQDFKQLEDFAAFSEVEQEALPLPPLPPSREAAKAGDRAKTTWLLLDVHFPVEIVIMW